ncbi:hypothetical protein ASF06_09795 [Agreia sp. Leaf244]|uniref:DUF4870 domain-containing protein n=1 Tax=Agreia sp. Leaf244 TaxID=1736305 RepID=UPI0006FC005E|nr:DUF4870 domain-containing protein [Agreia sp. Leaf244]KQO10443.1 hypothetical protein ASF06_09795 [Agreia sp. Leaf244]
MTTGSSYESLPPQTAGQPEPAPSSYQSAYQQPYPQVGQQPNPPAGYSQPLAAAPTGALAYGLGFLAYIPIPYLSLLVAGIVMAAVYPSQKTKGELAAENARQAANWGLSLIAYIVLDFLFFAIMLATRGDDSTGFFPIGIPVVLFFALGIAHLVVIIMGLVAANKRTVLRNRIAIPFMR